MFIDYTQYKQTLDKALADIKQALVNKEITVSGELKINDIAKYIRMIGA